MHVYESTKTTNSSRINYDTKHSVGALFWRYPPMNAKILYRFGTRHHSPGHVSAPQPHGRLLLAVSGAVKALIIPPRCHSLHARWCPCACTRAHDICIVTIFGIKVKAVPKGPDTRVRLPFPLPDEFCEHPLQPPLSAEVGGRDNAGAGAWTAGERELQELEALARALVDVGAGVVACQRLIHPHLRRCLSERGVLPLERLSAANVAAFQKVGRAPNNIAKLRV